MISMHPIRWIRNSARIITHIWWKLWFWLIWRRDKRIYAQIWAIVVIRTVATRHNRFNPLAKSTFYSKYFQMHFHQMANSCPFQARLSAVSLFVLCMMHFEWRVIIIFPHDRVTFNVNLYVQYKIFLLSVIVHLHIVHMHHKTLHAMRYFTYSQFQQFYMFTIFIWLVCWHVMKLSSAKARGKKKFSGRARLREELVFNQRKKDKLHSQTPRNVKYLLKVFAARAIHIWAIGFT